MFALAITIITCGTTLNPGRRAERDGRARRREDLRDVEFSSSREPRYGSHARGAREAREARDFEGSWQSVPRDPRDPRSVPRPRPPGAYGAPVPPSWSLEREPREPREARPARTGFQNIIIIVQEVLDKNPHRG